MVKGYLAPYKEGAQKESTSYKDFMETQGLPYFHQGNICKKLLRNWGLQPTPINQKLLSSIYLYKEDLLRK